MLEPAKLRQANPVAYPLSPGRMGPEFVVILAGTIRMGLFCWMTMPAKAMRNRSTLFE